MRLFYWLSLRLHPVNEDIEAEPDDVYKVPVPSRAFEAKMLLRREVAFLQTQGDEEQHQHAHENVETMKARQHKKGGAKDARAELEVQIGVGMVVLIALNAEENRAEQHCHPHKHDGLAAIASDQCMMRNRHRHA